MKRLLCLVLCLLVCACAKMPTPSTPQMPSNPAALPASPAAAPNPAPAALDTFDYTANGCFPPKGECYRIPDELNKGRCEAFQVRKQVVWQPDCSRLPNAACVALCEAQKGPEPQFVISTPVKVSDNPEGFRGWSMPHLFVVDGKQVVQYWGSVDGRIGNYIITQTSSGWSAPKELKAGPGTVVIGKGENYLLQWSGWTGYVNLVVLDGNFNEKKTVPVQAKQEFRAWALGVVDSKGTLHMSWNTFSNGVWALKYASYDGKTVSEPRNIVSSTEVQYGATPWVVVDSNDVVYVFWVQSVNKDNEGFYAYLKEGKWSSPIDLTNSKEDDCWNKAFGNGDEVHFFEQACGPNHTADLHHVVLKDGAIVKQEIFDIPFSEGSVAFEGDKIHLVSIDPTTSEVNGNTLKFKFTIDYKYFDGMSWYSSPMIPQMMVDNAEWNTVDLTPGLPEDEMGIAPDGTREFVHEEHPEVVLLNGVLHGVFEYNSGGTYDAYYLTIRPKT